MGADGRRWREDDPAGGGATPGASARITRNSGGSSCGTGPELSQHLFFFFYFRSNCLVVICIILAYTASLLLLEDKPSHRPSNLPFLRPTPSSTVRRLLREPKASTSTSSCTGVP